MLHGTGVWDLAYLAYRLVPLGPAGADPGPVTDDERRRRLGLLCRAYGGVRSPDVLPVVADRLTALAASTHDRADGDPELLGHAELYLRDAAWVTGRRTLLAG